MIGHVHCAKRDRSRHTKTLGLARRGRTVARKSYPRDLHNMTGCATHAPLENTAKTLLIALPAQTVFSAKMGEKGVRIREIREDRYLVNCPQRTGLFLSGLPGRPLRPRRGRHTGKGVRRLPRWKVQQPTRALQNKIHSLGRLLPRRLPCGPILGREAVQDLSKGWVLPRRYGHSWGKGHDRVLACPKHDAFFFLPKPVRLPRGGKP